jgi:hypothetical protein
MSMIGLAEGSTEVACLRNPSATRYLVMQSFSFLAEGSTELSRSLKTYVSVTIWYINWCHPIRGHLIFGVRQF